MVKGVRRVPRERDFIEDLSPSVKRQRAEDGEPVNNGSPRGKRAARGPNSSTPLLVASASMNSVVMKDNYDAVSLPDFAISFMKDVKVCLCLDVLFCLHS